jgi:hypothetical protein
MSKFNFFLRLLALMHLRDVDFKNPVRVRVKVWVRLVRFRVRVKVVWVRVGVRGRGRYKEKCEKKSTYQ